MSIISEFEFFQFDLVKVDTELVKHYLRDNKEFHSSACCRQGKQEQVTSDSCKNIIHYIESSFIDCESQLIPDLLVKMAQLAEKLRNNEDLFAQLDYMIRQKPIYEGRIHLDLIIKQLLYWSLSVEAKECVLKDFNGFMINVSDDAQLLSLGIIAFAFIHYTKIYIIAQKQMAVICHLFTTFCHEVGLRNVHLVLVEEIVEKEYDDSYYVDKTDYRNSRCAGIITERSDLDSAFDVFLASTSTSPWSLTHIYVQESVYNDFKAAIKWKCKKSNEDSENCNIYDYGTKSFILDYFDNNNVTNKHVVKVEAYRITKELLSLITNCKPDYVSLWANDFAEANEIAHGVDCKVIWLNDFGTFDGPAEVSKPIYQNAFMQYLPIPIPISMSACSEAWAYQECTYRRQKLSELLAIYERTPGIKQELKKIIHMLKITIDLGCRHFICGSKGSLCIEIRKLVGTLLVTAGSNNTYVLNAIASLTYGNALIIESTIYEIYEGLFDLLMKSDVPVHILKTNALEKDTTMVKSYYTNNFANVKIFFMNYGTIYAK